MKFEFKWSSPWVGIVLAAVLIVALAVLGLSISMGLKKVRQEWSEQSRIDCLAKCGMVPDEARREECYKLCDEEKPDAD
jgi:hypothetical protein